MNKKEYCLTHEAIATHNYFSMQIHGIEHGINDYVYLSRLYQKSVCGATCVMFHKVKINYDSNGESYIVVNERTFDGKRRKIYLSIDSFIRCDSMWGCTPISCKELKAFC